MSHAITTPVNIPTSLCGMASAKSPPIAWRTWQPAPRGRNPAHGVFQPRTPSVDEPRTPSAERTPPQHRKLDPSEDHAALPQTPPSRGLGLPLSCKIFIPPTPSDDSSANTATPSFEELIPGYDIPAPDVANPKLTLGQSRPPNTEPARPVGASHRDHTITDSTPCGKEQRFSFSFTFPPRPGFAPPSPAVPQQQPCAGCAEGRRQIEEQLQRIRWNQELATRQLAELEQRVAGRQLREAEEMRRAESRQETWKREDTQLASLLEAMRVVTVRLVEVATDSRRREDEHREQSERKETAPRQESETAREAQQSERKRAQEKWDALLETLQQHTEIAIEAQAEIAETLMRAWRDAESQRPEAADKVRCNTDQEHAAAVAV